MLSDEIVGLLNSRFKEVTRDIAYNSFIINGVEVTREQMEVLLKIDRFRGTLMGVELLFKYMILPSSPFYVMPDSPRGVIEVCVHRKSLHKIHKMADYIFLQKPVGVQFKYIKMSHKKLRVMINNGLGHKDFEGAQMSEGGYL